MNRLVVFTLLQLLLGAQAAQPCNVNDKIPCRIGVCVEENSGDFAKGLNGVCQYKTCSGAFGDSCPTGSSCYFLGGAASHGTCVYDGIEIAPLVAREAQHESSRQDWCGGIAGKQCRGGQICIGAGPSDMPGKCVSPSACGGSTKVPCPSGFTCKSVNGLTSFCVRESQPAPSTTLATITATATATPTPTYIFCGGFAGKKCPNPDQICVDDPRDSCAPPFGADCGGVCVTKTGEQCAGFIGAECSTGSCIDVPYDGCDPLAGGADCSGMCVTGLPPARQRCGTKGTQNCPSGQSCVVEPTSVCFGAKDCPGFCEITAPPAPRQRCGTRGTQNCPEGEMCFVDPASPCFGAKDCPGFCAEMGIFGGGSAV